MAEIKPIEKPKSDLFGKLLGGASIAATASSLGSSKPSGEMSSSTVASNDAIYRRIQARKTGVV